MNKKRLISLLTVMCMMLFLCPTVFAEDSNTYDSKQTGSLTISVARDDAPFVNGMIIKLYKVAEIKTNTETNAPFFRLMGDFEDCPVLIENNAESMAAASRTLAAYATAKAIEPDVVSTMKSDGIIRFDDLETGLYLVTGTITTAGEYVYLPSPALVCIPMSNDDEDFIYEIESVLKYEQRSANTPLDITVIKRWEDAGYESTRPVEITAQLYCDGELYEEVTLNEKNSWSYHWYDLDSRHLWQVMEKTFPTDYTVLITQTANTYVITNTRTHTADDTPPTLSPTQTPDTQLPQTGMLWWPIPVLSIAGIVLCMFGWAINRRWKNKQ